MTSNGEFFKIVNEKLTKVPAPENLTEYTYYKNKVMPEACIMYLYTNLRHTLLIHILILYCSNIPYSINISY